MVLRTNWVRQKLHDKEATLGTFVGLGSPNVSELLAHAGFDWLVIETEHNGLDMAEIEHVLMAMNGTDTIPIIRLPAANQFFIQRALDVGGLGILVPMVKSAAEVAEIVRATRYPPAGTRSFGPLRASRYTFDNADYLARADDNILVILILETKEAVANLEEILSVPGVDGIYLGPFDLCLSLGLDPMHQPFPELETIVERALTLCKAKRVAFGIGCSTPQELVSRHAQGCTLLGYGTDYSLLAKAARTGVEAFRALAPTR
jgi:4-hydroxy-2-oxoheptanedioate aldolase